MRTTVVIATRDRAALLRVCLDSVAAQSRAADEIIVVDDGKDPATRKVCATFERVRVLASGGRGIGFARNVGLDAATGDVIVVQDDDDVMLSGRIADHLKAFDDATDVTFGGWINVDPAAPVVRLAFVPGHPAPTLASLLLGGANVSHGGMAYRTETMRRFRYDDSLAVACDVDINARMLAAGCRFKHVGAFVQLRRLHAGSVTTHHADVQQSVKDGLRARLLAENALAPPIPPGGVPIDRDALRVALQRFGLDGAKLNVGLAVKTLDAAIARFGADGSSGVVALGTGGFVDVLVSSGAGAWPSVVQGEVMAGVVPRLVAGRIGVDDMGIDPSTLLTGVGLAGTGARVFIAIDGAARQTLVDLDRGLKTLSPQWRFIAGHPLIETCFGRAVGLVLASNRFASAAAAERAMQAVLRVTATVFGKTRGPHVAGLAHQDGRLFALETEG